MMIMLLMILSGSNCRASGSKRLVSCFRHLSTVQSRTSAVSIACRFWGTLIGQSTWLEIRTCTWNLEYWYHRLWTQDMLWTVLHDLNDLYKYWIIWRTVLCLVSNAFPKVRCRFQQMPSLCSSLLHCLQLLCRIATQQSLLAGGSLHTGLKDVKRACENSPLLIICMLIWYQYGYESKPWYP